MGPPDCRREQSSESDEDGSVRHDKFKSERFQENNLVNSRKDRSKYNDKYSKRYKDDSPKMSSRHREEVSSTSYRNEFKSRHDQRDSSRRHHSKSSRSVGNETSAHYKKSSDLKKVETLQPEKLRKNNLSSLLKNFDKRVESKRNNSENSLEIGPALPPHLRQGQVETESISNSTKDTTIGPALPKQLKNIEESSSNGSSKFDHSVKSDTESSLVLENEVSIDISKGTTLIEEESDVSKSNLGNISNSIDNSSKIDNLDSSEQHLSEPALPTKSEPETYGPILPAKLELHSYGPALPPTCKKDALEGPALPLDIANKLEETSGDDSEDDDMVGPQIEGKMSKSQYLLEIRAWDIKRKLDEEKSGTSKMVEKREEWMLELPPEKAANLGLGPRSFRMKQAPDMSNRSSWTDTPADRLRKEQQALRGEPEPVDSEEITRMAFIKERDNVMDNMLQKNKEEQPKSLLAIHQKKLKKKKKKEEKEGKKKERRPFDRNIDLQVNRFDEAQKKAIFKKAQLLNSRFSSGESKYL
uniref:DUF3752 domain-containing protein n=1 Tax=Graphocephala atropunctata TaxID=36148 RepID=A0A1B6LY21_9HEMI